MKKPIIFIGIIALLVSSCKQEHDNIDSIIHQDYVMNNQEIALAPGIDIPPTPAGFTLWLPKGNAPTGMVVFQHWNADTTTVPDIVRLAHANALAVLYINTHNLFEFYFDSEDMETVSNQILKLTADHKIPTDNILFCGMSLEGTRALKLTKHLYEQGHTRIPKAIAVCDAPLDMIRFHTESNRAALLNAHPKAANEGYWVSSYLESSLGGTPADTIEAYLAYSPYSYSALDAEGLQAYRAAAIRAYTEPDVQWWMETRRKDYYGMNALDMAGFINELQIQGNAHAELIITTDKGYKDDMERHPHTWNIVDETELIEWFVGLNE